MSQNPSQTTDAFETILDRIKETRADRDAAARNCAKALLGGDTNAAMWYANDFQAHELVLPDLYARLKAAVPTGEA